MILKFDRWLWQTLGHLFYATSSFVNHFKAIGEFKLEWQSGSDKFHSKSVILVPCDIEISRMTLKNNRAPLLCYFKIWATFHSHLWIRTGVTVQKIPISGQNWYLFYPCDLEIWWITLTNNRAPFLCYLNLYACIISSPYVKSNWAYGPEMANLGFDFGNLDFWLLTLNFCIDINFCHW